MPLRKLGSKNDNDEVKDIINKNVATFMMTQPSFGELLKLNGCSDFKRGSVGSKIRKQLLKEADNGELTPETVMPRAYELIGEFLGISNVKTFKDMPVENYNQTLTSQKELNKKLDKQKKIEEKFRVNLTGKQWFQCLIEEVKYSTFSNQPKRNIDYAYVIVNEDNFEIIKESVWIKSNMGSRKIYFYNITGIDFDARGRLHASSSIIINTKGAEHIQFKFVTENNFNLMNNAFESFIEKIHRPQQTEPIQQNTSTQSNADELLKYAELYEKGLLTKEEFGMKKAELLGNPKVGGIETKINQKNNYSLKQDFVEKNDISIENKPNFCPNCGNPIDLDSKFCSNCGNKL